MSARVGITWVLAAPSGTGKTTLCREILARDSGISLSVSHTTRAKRPNEDEGRHYYFVDDGQFDELVAAKAFLEYARYNEHQYGTSWAAIDAGVSKGRDMLLEIEVQGARQVRQKLPEARLVFVLPPSMAELEQRLVSRGTDLPEAIRRRIDEAEREIDEILLFNYAVTNSDLSQCVGEILSIIRAEREGDPQTIAALREKFSPQSAVERFGSPGQ